MGYKTYAQEVDPKSENPYAPFASRLDWEITHWAKLRGSGSTAFSDLLAIEEVHERLGLSYKNTDELNKIIDDQLPNRWPVFKHFEVCVADEKLAVFARGILECTEALYGDTEHARYLVVAAERHYADADQTVRLYHGLHTGKWWWETQAQLEEENPGATIVPIILSSDKTQLTLFRNKTAYPVYLTIGNLPKEIRRKPSCRSQILLAYLPTSRLEHIKNKTARRRTLANLFHACMSMITEPLREAGIKGVPMTSGDGVTRRCHPILAIYVGDYPEQVLVTATYTGDCPICKCPHSELGCYPCIYGYRDVNEVLDTLAFFGTADYKDKCDRVGIKPIQHPFWEHLPYVDMFRSITPDVLHQLLQGVIKHLLSWLTDIIGEEEVDARVKRLPPNHSIRIFYKGLSGLSRVTGTEHKQITRFILSLVVDVDLPGNEAADLVVATTSLLEFLYMSQYSVHSSTTLAALEQALSDFHAKKDVFIRLGAHGNFIIPKLHMMAHYVRAIMLYGTTDNYNTKATERLHIDFAKEAYRSTNRKDELPQMTKWLERRQKVLQHAKYVQWRVLYALSQGDPSRAARTEPAAADKVTRWHPPDMACPLQHHMTKWPSRRAVSVKELVAAEGYGATHLIPALARFVVEFNAPNLARNEVEAHAASVRFPFTALPVYHKIRFCNTEYYGNETLDAIHAQPQRVGSTGNILAPDRFDTALVHIRSIGQPSSSIHDMRVGQVRTIFSLPQKSLRELFPSAIQVPRHLVYVEWFSKFAASPDPRHRMYKVRRLTGDAKIASVVPLTLIERSVHLFPKWGGSAPAAWTTSNVLDECITFYLNHTKDPHSYYNLS
ncbi:hypothetical protein C8Q72DRAFT_985880 [Fomitopsis betulina]|nr:hypothetical protein C8Q72DRAFT_985880 [Fomitopsis betulina]